MCGYVLFLNLCGCFGELLFDTACPLIYQEIDRINDAEAWTADTINELPFDVPDYCVPGWHNTWIIPSYGVCSPQWWSNCPSVTVPGYPQFCITEEGGS
jgi:hypothetical protein